MIPSSNGHEALSFLKCRRAALALAGLLLASPGAHAIPAPDLVINLLASVAQLAGLALAGLGALAVRFRSGAGSRHSGGPAWLPGALAGLICLLLLGNVGQLASHLADKNQRLEANLWRKPADWERPLNAPQLDAQALADKIAAGQPLQIVDVREPEEFEVAHLPQARNLRYADLLLDPAALRASAAELVLVCDSGKRSGEVCERLQQQGQPCSVLEGGYPRWVALGHPLWLATSGWRARFSALPAYPGDSTFLDTADVTEQVHSDGAGFLDVRSPAEFAASHLPGAINLPMRGLATPALAQALQALEHRPWITACYDNRSCFHAKVLGLKLQRLGHDVRGRYTVPHEYPMPARVGERSALARVQRALSRGLDLAVKPLALALHGLAGQLGSLVPALLLLLLLTRLPFGAAATKAARDRQRQRADARQLADLRAHYRDDPFRLQRALARWRRASGQTPWRNLAVSLLQVALFAVCFAAVRTSAPWHSEAFLWLPDISQPDPLALLSGAIAVFTLAVLRHLQAGPSPAGGATGAARGRWLGLWLLHAGLAGALGWATRTLPAALTLYLALSLAWLSLQQQGRWLKTTALRALRRSWTRLRQRPARPRGLLIPLEQAGTLTQAGGKALRLGQLRQAGFCVPEGWVLPHDTLTRLFATGSPDAATALALTRALTAGLPRTGTHRYAVRSSAACEDSATQSFAGVFDTELNVPPEGLLAAIGRVWRSYQRQGAAPQSGGVIVQTLVAADYAGVLFTRAPDNPAAMRVECVAGLGHTLVDGSTTPQSFMFGQLTGRLDPRCEAPPLGLGALLRTGQAVQTLLGAPQDIEWAWQGGRFHLLQARNITADLQAGTALGQAIEAERQRLMALVRPYHPESDDVLLEQTDLSADLPRPTPLSLSLMQRLRSEGGSTDRAMQALGLAFQAGRDTPDEVQTAFGQTCLLRWPAWRNSQRVGLLSAFLLSRRAPAIEAGFVQQFLPGFLLEMRWRDAVDFGAMETADLLATQAAWTGQFVTRHYVEADLINLAAEFYSQAALQALQRRHLPRSLLAHAPGAAFGAIDLHTHGHRASTDWELAQPRFDEDPAAFAAWQAAVQPPALASAAPDPLQDVRGSIVPALVTRARHFACLKERAKHECLRPLRSLRRLLLALDGRFGLEGRIFFLRLEELADLPTRTSELKTLALARQQQHTLFASLQIGPVLRTSDLETLFNTAWAPDTPDDSATGTDDAAAGAEPGLYGRWVAGTAPVTGPVRLLREPGDLQQLAPGEIAVMQLASPQWIGALPVAAGLITTVGGQLAHLALLARERHLPAIFGATDALQRLHTGDTVTLHPSGRIERRF
jgi:rhodanese-related sulfurtransferase/phosphohistidine swiveling domain-containing protein